MADASPQPADERSDDAPRAGGAGRVAAILRRRWVRIAAAVLGTALLAAALATVAGQRGSLAAAWGSLAGSEPWLIAALPLCVLANLVTTSWVFHALIVRFGRVGRTEMAELIAASTLLNLVPLRPGLFGRVAWHATVNGIPARRSVQTIVEAIALGVACTALLLAGLAVGQWLPPALRLPVAMAAPFLAAVIAVATPRLRPLAPAALARAADLLVWSCRYVVAFRLIDAPVSDEAAIALAAIAGAASLIPLAGNGLGIREWTTGLLAPMVASVDVQVGLSAELVNRAAELAVVVPVGLIAIAALAARRRR